MAGKAPPLKIQKQNEKPLGVWLHKFPSEETTLNGTQAWCPASAVNYSPTLHPTYQPNTVTSDAQKTVQNGTQRHFTTREFASYGHFFFKKNIIT